MAGLLEVIDGGIGNSIQDAGRFGYRLMGIAVSGCLDYPLARCANALVGNLPESACIEIRARGPRLAVRQGKVRVAMAGELTSTLRRRDGGVQHVLPWTSVTLHPEDVLEVGSIFGDVAYLAVSGGIESPLQLGSRSTYQRAMIGGIDGRPIVTGNRLPCASVEHQKYRESQADPWGYANEPVRVMLGPQDDLFQPDSIKQFLGSDYQVTPQMDRMGMRLEGAPLMHVTPESADIVSDGVTPGAIQVPGNGQPIILLADCQTVGGYPKIATVISADMPRLAHFRPGQSIRFCAVDAAQAKKALLEREARWISWRGELASGLPNAAALYNDPSVGWFLSDE